MALCKLNPTLEFLKTYKIDTVSCVPSNLICMLCGNILINARQTPCGCRYCADCIAEEFRAGKKICPGRTEDCSNEVLDINRDIICDNNANREIGKLRIKCPNSQCAEENELRQIPNHVNVCDFKEEMCDKCNQTVIKKDKEYHSIRQCEYRQVECEFCHEAFSHRELTTVHHNVQHERFCDLYRSPCPNDCGLRHITLIKAHLPVCLNRPQPCPYSQIGCPLVHVARQQIDEHLHAEVHSHAKSLIDYINNLNNEITTLKLANNALQDSVDKFISTVSERDQTFERRHNDFLWKVENYSKALKVAEEGKNQLIESKAFLSDRYGYKMRLQLYPNGDKVGKGQYISVYFLIMHGKYDDILPWPFSGTVTMTLVNCKGQDDHVKVCRYKDLVLESVTDGVVGAGCVKFFEISQLAQRGFLKNDNLFIKCVIE